MDGEAVAREGPGPLASSGTAKKLKEKDSKGKDRKDRKETSTLPGQRFQCQKCDKSFSRVENLTRHQANHEDIGKFACLVCRKRFTRSDLLNRHRRIHTSQAESPTGGGSTNEYTPSPQSSIKRELYDGFVRSQAHDASSRRMPVPSNDMYPSQYGAPDYQNSIPRDDVSRVHPSMPGHAPAQGLTSLMEAALAPHEIAFTPAQNFDPSMWGGFMMLGDNSNAYMGSYDADISWTLSSFRSESSPGRYIDQDMMQPDFAENPYQYQAVSYRHDDVNHLDAADAEDEDTNDWPDKEGHLDRQRRAPRVVPLHLLPTSWQNTIEEARVGGLSATTIRPYQHLNSTLRSSLLAALNGVHLQNQLSKPEITDSMFPPAEALDFFLRLYIRYVHPRFPILHLPTFDIYSAPPLLLIAMMFLGSSHARTDRGRLSRLFYSHLRLAVMRVAELDTRALRVTDNIFTVFLLLLAGTWSGSKQAYEFAEGGRGILITACRRARLLDNRPSAMLPFEQFQRPGLSQLDAVWLAWAETEKRKRLGLCVYLFDCMYPALFNNQPYISKAETTNCAFPCADEYWEATTAESWKMLVGAADVPPVTYFLHALNACLLRKWVKPPPPVTPISAELGKIILIYALHTHIFEWRQATCMLNPTGLRGSLGDQALPLGEGFKDRRRWLVDGLDSWRECYQSHGTSTAASLLHRLGYVALDVSLSDMHLVAGRSNNTHDGNFAEENLRHWANSELAGTTMGHVYGMLELCHHCIGSGVVEESSFEVAVCLFTGGIVCWAFAKLSQTGGVEGERARQEIKRAAGGLAGMGCWRMCSMFGRILGGFKDPREGR